MLKVYAALLVALITGLASMANAESAPLTLLVKGSGARDYQAGLAVSFEVRRDGVRLVLPKSIDGEKVAESLRAELPGGVVKVTGARLDISGLGPTLLLNRLSRISVEAFDPIEALLTAGGSPIAMGAPDSGGSIRVTGAAAAAGNQGVSLMELVADEFPKWAGEVVKVSRGEFPEVELLIRVQCHLERDVTIVPGAEYSVKIPYSRVDGRVDFNAGLSQRNLVAFYLEPGDRIWGINQSEEKGKLQGLQIRRASLERPLACKTR